MKRKVDSCLKFVNLSEIKMKNLIKSSILITILICINSQACPTLQTLMSGISYEVKNKYNIPITMKYRFPNLSKSIDLNQYISNSNNMLKPAEKDGNFIRSCVMNDINKDTFILSATCNVSYFPYKNTLTIDTFTRIKSYKYVYPQYSTCKWLSFLDCQLTLEGSMTSPTGKLILNCPNPNALNTRISYTVDLNQYIGLGSLSNGTDNIMTVKTNGKFSSSCNFCDASDFILRCQCKGMWATKWSSINLLTQIKIHTLLGYQ